MNDYQETDQEMLRLRAHLQRAVKSTAPPPFLEARIRNTVRAEAHRPRWPYRLSQVAAAIVVCVGVIIAYQLGHLRFTAASQEAYVNSVTRQVATLMRVGLGDHIHCAVFRKAPKVIITLVFWCSGGGGRGWGRPGSLRLARVVNVRPGRHAARQ